MADEEKLALLKSGVSEWNKWRQLDVKERSLGRPILNWTIAARPDVGVVDLRGANLEGVDLRYAQLEHCSLEGANLNGADLRGARLDSTILSEAKLVRANLQHASLNGTIASFANFEGANVSATSICYAILHIVNFLNCNLEVADLRDSDLRDADLRYSNLKRSELSLVKFIGTKLDGADMNDASMGSTVFAGVDLSEVLGLDSVQHRGPSSIGLDTLYMSHGTIPEVFLRGAGISERFLQYLPPLLVPNAIDYYSCFISYSHQQKSFARRLHDQLQMRGVRCWLDEHQILPGQDIYDMIDQGIRLWDKVLLCCSKESLSSWWVNDEIDKALEKERALQQERGVKVLTIVPINLDNFVFEGWQDGRAATLRKRMAANFVDWEHDNSIFESAFEKIVRTLRSDIEAQLGPPEPKL